MESRFSRLKGIRLVSSAALARGIACIVFAYFAGGCATLTLTTVGTIVGSVADPVQGFFSAGKLHSAEMVDFRTAVAAARQAANDLGMRPVEVPRSRQGKDPTVLELWFVDDKCHRLTVKLERRARSLALVDINVGFFGSNPVAHLYLDRLRKHLPQEAQMSHDPRTG